MDVHEPAVPVRQITREELWLKRQQGEAFVLVDVLLHEHFTRVHLPGAVNVPLNLLHDLAPLLFSPLDEIIVYCANTACTLSTTAAKITVARGMSTCWTIKAASWIGKKAIIPSCAGHNRKRSKTLK